MRVQFSIVTASLNRRDLLGRAVRSAVAQGLEGVEHIIVDGVSNDGTLEMLREFPHLLVSSEPDKSLYEAWNKGIRRARGDFIVILNSDDELPAGAFAHVRSLAEATPQADLISGAVEIVRQADGGMADVRIIDHPPMVSLREQDIGPGIPLTNGRYISRRLLERVGPFDERYPVISDRQFFLRVLLSDAVRRSTPSPLYRYHVHAGSLTLNDAPASRPLSQQCLRAACDGMSEARAARDFAAYRRWHAWAAGYLAGIEFRDGDQRAAFGTLAAATRRDPAWLFRMAPAVMRHIAERAERLGRKAA